MKINSSRTTYPEALMPALAAILVVLIVTTAFLYFPGSGTSSSSSSSSSSTVTSQLMSASPTSSQSTTSSSLSLTFQGETGGVTSEATPSSAHARGSGEQTGVIVPIFISYSHAQAMEVDEVIQVRLAHPSVPITTVINPSGGPGEAVDSNDTDEVTRMQSTGIKVLGYVTSSWGERSISSIEADMLSYHEWYHVNGIYLDEMPNWDYNSPSGAWYYGGPDGTYMPAYFSNLTGYAKSLGMTRVFGNSGADVPPNLVGTVSTIGIFENQFLPSLSTGEASLPGRGGWHTAYNKTDFAFFTYDAQAMDPFFVAAASNYVGRLFITNGTRPHPYVGLPSYFPQLVATLDSLVPVTVRASIANATLLDGGGGFPVTVTEPDGSSSFADTPATLNVLPGANVTISMGDSGGRVFDHWSDGSRTRVRTVTTMEALNLVAYYR